MIEMKQLEDMCQAVPRPDPQRLASARVRVLAGIAEIQDPVSRKARERPRHATRLGRRWPGWAAPPLPRLSS
jgi:hypothetical protein